MMDRTKESGCEWVGRRKEKIFPIEMEDGRMVNREEDRPFGLDFIFTFKYKWNKTKKRMERRE